jgi:hypothetical protein
MAKLYSTIFNLVALFVAIYIGVDLFYRLVGAQLIYGDTEEIVIEQAPQVKNRKRPPLKDFRVVMDRNIFGSKEKAAEGIKPTDIETLEPTTLKVALLGTVKKTPLLLLRRRTKGNRAFTGLEIASRMPS